MFLFLCQVNGIVCEAALLAH